MMNFTVKLAEFFIQKSKINISLGFLACKKSIGTITLNVYLS